MSNYKVCHITSVHQRYDSRILKKQCVSLSKAGFEVMLLCADTLQDEYVDGINIISIQHTAKNRVQRFFYSTYLLFKKAVLIDADIYQIHDPELIPVGLKLLKKGKLVIFDSHEDIPNLIKDKEYIPFVFRRLLSFVYIWYEKYALAQFTALLAVNDVIASRLKLFNKKTIVITNYPILIDICSNKEVSKNICFAGAVTPNYLHHNIIDSIGAFPDLRYCLAGPTTDEYLERLKTKLNWAQVDYLGKVSYDKVLDIYSKSIIGVAIHDYTSNVNWHKGSLGIIKNFEFMMAGLPLICTDFYVWKEIVETEKCGICVNPHDIKAITKAIEYLLSNPSVAKRMGENGRKAVVEKYNWDIQEISLIKLYNSILR